MNIQKLMKQAQDMQKKMQTMQDKLAEQETEGSSGGGMVKVVINGKGDAKKVTIDPKIVDPADITILEDLIVAAFNDAKTQNNIKMEDEMSKITGDMGLPAGLKLPF